MAPRGYTLGRRAETAAATRARIVEAAIELYREQGLNAATLTAVADRADVSRGTVLNHFGDADGLLRAVLEHALASLDLPDAAILADLTTTEARVRRFVAEMFRFYERTSDWWRIFAGEGHELPSNAAFEDATRQYEAGVGRFMAAALGSAAHDRIVAVTVGTLVAPTTFYPLVGAGLSLEETTEVVADLVADLVARRGAAT